MITVQILINGEVLYARSAHRFCDLPNGLSQYRTDCNTVIEHNPKDGAIKLSKKMLDSINEMEDDLIIKKNKKMLMEYLMNHNLKNKQRPFK